VKPENSIARPPAAAGTALVVGATGSAGSAIVAELKRVGSFRVVELARKSRPGDAGSVSADLLDPAGLKQALRGLEDVTQLIFTARLIAPDGGEDRDLNALALQNLLEALSGSRTLRRIVLIHGTKWYGSHLGRYLVPAVETDTIPAPHFYHLQQNLTEAFAARHGVEWSALRPHTVFGFSPQPRHNLLLLLAQYAAVCVHEKTPLNFPGSTERFVLPTVATNADMLAKATVWAAGAPAARNEAFNINNGDQLFWRPLWPQLCEFFGAPRGGVEHVRLTQAMPAKAALWEKIRAAHGLVDTPWPTEGDWTYADGIFGSARVDIVSTAKIVKAGFGMSAGTDDTILGIMRRFRIERIIP